MRHLNYNHLLYFWTVAREGSIARATDSLHLTPQTISGQLKLLEEAIGEALFNRVGRGLVLTETGHLVYQYADEIFTLGAELSSRVKTGRVVIPAVLTVGIVNAIPKLIAYRILQPALDSELPIRLECREGSLESLLGELAVHRLDLILSDCSIPGGLNVKAFNHALGASNIVLYGTPELASRYAGGFPASLDRAPMLLPIRDNPIRRGLEDWFDQHDINPTIVAEFEDSALMKAFGAAGSGLFPVPAATSREVEKMYQVKPLGEPLPVSENYFAISPDRKLRHPAVKRIIDTSRELIFD
ncbi:MAG: transcriptional activator NhaR [Gammaproteobacteria bacterium]|nr:transcriptional activator NhaR [Pseudomonadales bacterium]MCP5349183.1 transcriptional activator NhaR [Pseudomonadales bacterium]